MMESTQRRAEQATVPLKSAAGDLHRAKSAGAASVQELKEFLQKHRGKSSQELLGELGKSNLVQAMIKSTIGCLILLVALTVVPYLTQGGPKEKKTKPLAAVAAKAQDAAASPAAKTAEMESAAGSTGVPEGVDVERAKRVMGLDETKTAPDDVNPREKELDDLLDNVK
jgi:hypothetical protein